MKVNINTQMNFSSKDCAYKELQNIENGQLFVQFGINNFIENDFLAGIWMNGIRRYMMK